MQIELYIDAATGRQAGAAKGSKGDLSGSAKVAGAGRGADIQPVGIRAGGGGPNEGLTGGGERGAGGGRRNAGRLKKRKRLAVEGQIGRTAGGSEIALEAIIDRGSSG